MRESPIRKHESSVFTECIQQRSVCQEELKRLFSHPPPHKHRVETLYSTPCTVWRDLRSQKEEMVLLILTLSSYTTLDSFLRLAAQYLFGFPKRWKSKANSPGTTQ